MYPAPNHLDPDNRYNYAFNTPQPVDRWQLASRIDWNVSQATHAYVRLALENERQEWARGTWDCCSDFELPSGVVGHNKSWSVSANVTSVLSPSLTSEIVVSASQLKLDNDWEDPSKVRLSYWGLEGWRGIFDSTSDEAPMFFGSWGQGLGAFGTPGGLPAYAYNDSLSLGETLTKVASSTRSSSGRSSSGGGSSKTAAAGRRGSSAPPAPTCSGVRATTTEISWSVGSTTSTKTPACLAVSFSSGTSRGSSRIPGRRAAA
jgi:hypothetical protein